MSAIASSTSSSAAQPTQLQPSYSLPLAFVAPAIPALWLQPWPSLILALLGTFLLFQAVTIRLYFTETALDIYRSEKLLRRFPYQDWQNWRVFWPAVPILFYFKEVKSIHFLPILFDAKMLCICLERHCPLSPSS